MALGVANTVEGLEVSVVALAVHVEGHVGGGVEGGVGGGHGGADVSGGLCVDHVGPRPIS